MREFLASKHNRRFDKTRQFQYNECDFKECDTLNGEIKENKLIKTAFLLYLLIMLWLLFFQRIGGAETSDYWKTVSGNVNFVPLETVGRFLRSMLHPRSGRAFFEAVKNLGGNVVLFIPFGFFIPAVSGRLKKPLLTVLFGALCIAAVELVQLFTLLGKCDIDDLILNVIGISIGRFVFYLAEKKKISVDIF